MNRQNGELWKTATARITSKKHNLTDFLQVTHVVYKPDADTCSLCSGRIKKVFVVKNTDTGEIKNLGSDCVAPYYSKEGIQEGLRALQKRILEVKYSEHIRLIEKHPFKTKAMRTFIGNIKKGEYPWEELLKQLNKDYIELQFYNHADILQFIEDHSTMWIAKELKKFTEKKHYPTKWYISEMKKVIEKEKEKRKAERIKLMEGK